MAIQMKLLKDEELPLANQFFNDVYKTNRSFETFRWEFIDGPFGKAIYVGAIDDTFPQTKVVGIQCAIPIELISTSGKIVLTAKSEDTLVDPSYRGQKIFEKMYDVLFEESKKAGIKYIWGFTPAEKAFSRIGFDIPFKTQQALAVTQPMNAYRYLASLNTQNKRKQKIQIFGLSALTWMKTLFTGNSGTRGYTIVEGNVDLLN